MSSIDTSGLAAATNLVRTKLFEASAAQEVGKTKEALAYCREAVSVACRAMRELIAPHYEEISKEIPLNRKTTDWRDFLQDRDAVRKFLRAEELLLKEAGLEPGLVDAVINRCIDFLDREPDELTDIEMRRAFAAAEFRVCQDAAERLAKASEGQDRYAWLIEGRTALRATVGITIIGVNYKIFGPVEFFGQLSTGYGLSWLPTWPFGKG